MRIKRRSNLNAEEKLALTAWGDDIFQSDAMNLIWRPKELHLVLYAENIPVSKCGLVKQQVSVGGENIAVGGIGGVVTPPQWQGHGYASALLGEALNILAGEWQQDAAMLFCRQALVPFYQQRDWRLLSQPVTILQPSGMIPCPTSVMVYPLKRTGWPAGDISIGSPPW